MKRNAFFVGLLVVASLFTSACAPRRYATPSQRQQYTGPTEPMDDVVAQINANNAALPTLWARHYFEANVVDERKKSHFVNGGGVLVYKGPRGMRLVGDKDVVGRVFEIGSSDDRYWLTLSPPNESSRMWWGWYRNLGKPCVDASQMPIRPDLVLEVLGVATIDTNFMQPPVPTMRFNNYAYGGTGAYMFVWNMPAGDRWVAQKEIWYDRASKLPRAVLLFDRDGRIVLEAKLSEHAPLEVDGTPKERWPVVARKFELMFPDTGSTMTFDLDEVALERKGVPTRRGITFPQDAKVDQTIQLDKDCTD